ncbi:MAG TPA: thioredoxin family protein [Burkholderiales bacterium]|nr:thioredoxin family protein [Burkholderiales bacterium]
MAAVESTVCQFDWPAVDFDLMGVDGKRYDLSTVKGPKGLLLMFICNHCPFVKSIRDRIVRDCLELQKQGVGSVAIMSNDPAEHEEDSFANMQIVAKRYGFPFPYLLDDTQMVAKQYGAVCTPEFFGFNAALKLQYHGRLDESRRDPVPNARRELFEAMKQIAATGKGPATQFASIGCSIKWRSAKVRKE